jgi:uncharacterized protein (DUF305 family)
MFSGRQTRWALAAAALVVAGCDGTTEPSANQEEQVAYIDAIVPHHQIATMRADEALAKANREGTRRVAQRMKEDQAREIARFRAVRVELTGSADTPPPMMPQPIPAGPAFDRMFYEMMIPHHQGAIDQSTLAHGSNVQAVLDSLAHHTIEEQRMEQQEFRDSLRVIFGVQ